jgi:hypothetical protein
MGLEWEAAYQGRVSAVSYPGEDIPGDDRKKYGKCKICDERFYSYWVPLL